MSNWNLPPGCTDKMVDEAFGYKEGRRGVYTVTVTRTITATITVEVEAGSEEDANWDGAIEAKKIPLEKWTIDGDDIETTNVEGPREQDLAADRGDWEFHRDHDQ